MMREYFWSVFIDIKSDERYYWYYQIRSKKIDNFFTGFSLIVSFGGITSWVIWEQYAFICAIIIGVSQIASAIQCLMPYSSRVSACEFLLPEMRSLLDKVEHYWNFIQTNDVSEEEINNKALEFKTERNKIENKYTGSTYWPINRKFERKASQDVDIYLDSISPPIHNQTEK